MITDSQLNRVKNKVTEDLSAALDDLVELLESQDDALNPLEQQALLLKTRHYHLLKNREKGLIDYAVETEHRNKITAAVLSLLRNIREEYVATDMVISKNLTPNASITEPPRFIGFSDLLPKLHKMLEEARRPVVIHGVTGSGKTTFAQAYRARYGEEYHHYAWISFFDNLANSLVKNDEGLLTGTDLVFTKGGLSDHLEKIKAQMMRLKGKNLLIIDGLEKNLSREENAFLLQLCLNFQWKILITSQQKFEKFDHFLLKLPNREQAQEIYRLYRDDIRDDPEVVEKLIAFVDYHPLVIELIAKTINNSIRLTPQMVLRQLKEKGLRSLKGSVTPTYSFETVDVEDYLRSVFDFGILNDTQQELLVQISAVGIIPIDFESLVFMLGYVSDEEQQDLLEAQLAQLIKQGWLKRQGNTFYMINIIRQVVLARLRLDEQNSKPLLDNLGAKLYQKFDEDDTAWYTYRHFLPYLEELEKNLKVKTPAYACLTDNLLWICLNWSEDKEKALVYGKKNVAVHEAIYAPDSLRLAEAYNNLSLVFQDLEDYVQAFDYQQKALAIRRQAGNEDLHAESLMHLALLYGAEHEDRDLQKAVQLSQQAVTKLEKLYPAGHLHLANAYFNSALLVNKTANATEFEKLILKALRLEEDFLETHPNLVSIYWTYAVYLYDKEDYEESIEYWNKALAMAEEVYPALHVQRGELYFSYANVLYEQALLNTDAQDGAVMVYSAMEYAQAALENYQRNKRENDLADLYALISQIMFTLGDFENAEGFAEVALELMGNQNEDEETMNAMRFQASKSQAYATIATEWIVEKSFREAFENETSRAVLIGATIDFVAVTPDNKNQTGDRFDLANFTWARVLEEQDDESEPLVEIIGDWSLDENLQTLILNYQDEFVLVLTVKELKQNGISFIVEDILQVELDEADPQKKRSA